MRLRMSPFLCLCHKCEHSYAYAYVTSVNQALFSESFSHSFFQR